MQTEKLIVVSLLIAFAGAPAHAKDYPGKIKALMPEVQTAKWAQKWWMPRHKQKLADMKKQERVDLLMIGDSITHGWEGKGKKVWGEYYAKRNAFNIGFSGDRTENVLWRIQNGAVKGISPKLAIVMIGTNNAGHRQEKPGHTAEGIKGILGELQERLPETHILVLAIFPRGADANDKLRKLNEGTNKLVAPHYAKNKRVTFLDINAKFLDKDGKLPKDIMPDRLHPNENGYRIWAEAMEPTVKKLMGEKKAD